MVATYRHVASVFLWKSTTYRISCKTLQMRYLLLIAALLSANIALPQMTEEEKACVRQQNLAQKDWYNKEMKYYRFGIMAAGSTKRGQAEARILKEYYNILLVSMGCIVDETLLCYNEQVDKLMQHKYGKDFWKKISQQADSLINTKPPR